jgi:hypothetical protein
VSLLQKKLFFGNDVVGRDFVAATNLQSPEAQLKLAVLSNGVANVASCDEVAPTHVSIPAAELKQLRGDVSAGAA